MAQNTCHVEEEHALLRVCVLFLNLRKEKKGIACPPDLGARSLGICSKEEEEVSAARSVGGFSVGSNNGRCKETLIVARRMGWEASCLARLTQ